MNKPCHTITSFIIAKCLLGLALLTFWIGIGPIVWAYDLKDNAIKHAQQGQLYMDRGQVELAIEEFKASLQLNPGSTLSAALYNSLGLAYSSRGEYPYAFVSFQRACRLQPTFSLYYRNLIDAYAAAQQLPQVQREFQAIVTRNPDNAEVWFLLGLLYKRQGNKQAAKPCFERFLKLQPESEMAQAAKDAL